MHRSHKYMQHECAAPVSNYDVRVHCANTQIKRKPSEYASLLCDMLIIDWFNRHHLNFISKPPESFSTLPSTRFLSLSMKYHYASIKFFLDDFIMIKSVLIDGWTGWLLIDRARSSRSRCAAAAAATSSSWHPATCPHCATHHSSSLQTLDRIGALKICSTRSIHFCCVPFSISATQKLFRTSTHMNREFRKIS